MKLMEEQKVRRSTVYDVASRAGVSTATVSFTFSHPDRVRPKTRAKVLKAAEELGYVPSASARGLARGRTGALGLYSFDMLLEYPQGTLETGQLADEGTKSELEADARAYPLYVDEVQRGFELECWHRGQAVLLSTGTAEQGDRTVTDVAGRVDGLAIFPGRNRHLLPLDRLSGSLPVVYFGAGSGQYPGMYISCDNEQGMLKLVDHLYSEHGVTHMGFVGGLSTYDIRIRYEAFLSFSAADHARKVEMELLEDSDLEGHNNLPLVQEAIAAGTLPQAIVCGNDQAALYVIELLQKQGLQVSKDVIVTGFDGIVAGRLSNPTVTTVRQPMEAMGRLAAKLLDEQGRVPWQESKHFKLETTLIPRGSCGCASN